MTFRDVSSTLPKNWFGWNPQHILHNIHMLLKGLLGQLGRRDFESEASQQLIL